MHQLLRLKILANDNRVLGETELFDTVGVRSCRLTTKLSTAVSGAIDRKLYSKPQILPREIPGWIFWVCAEPKKLCIGSSDVVVDAAIF